MQCKLQGGSLFTLNINNSRSFIASLNSINVQKCSNLLSTRRKTNNINVRLLRQINYRQNCQTLDEYSEKTVRGAMGCDVLKTNYNCSRIR